MLTYDKAEVSVVLHAAEILRKYQTKIQINVSQFCEQIGISRKNAYKHKNKNELENQQLKQENEQLKLENTELKKQLKQNDDKGKDADLYKDCLDILTALNEDKKKKR